MILPGRFWLVRAAWAHTKVWCRRNKTWIVPACTYMAGLCTNTAMTVVGNLLTAAAQAAQAALPEASQTPSPSPSDY